MKSYEIVDDSGVDYNFLGDDRPWKGQVVQGNPDPSAYPDAVTVEKPFGLAGTYTASASCFKEHLVGGGWKLDEALAYIREVQPKAMASGWCLMLGGGVLNNGHGPDLDLLAYPRTVGVVRTDLLHHLPAQAIGTATKLPAVKMAIGIEDEASITKRLIPPIAASNGARYPHFFSNPTARSKPITVPKKPQTINGPCNDIHSGFLTGQAQPIRIKPVHNPMSKQITPPIKRGALWNAGFILGVTALV